MLKVLKTDDLEVTCNPQWLESFSKDFHKRFLSLLGYAFRKFPCSLSLSILDPKKNNTESLPAKEDIDRYFTAYDIRRLESYANNLIDYHLVLDLMPSVSQLFFLQKLMVSLAAAQSAVLLGLGLQHKTVEEIATELTINVQAVLAYFQKAIRKIVQKIRDTREKQVASELPATQSAKEVQMDPTVQSLEEDLQESETGTNQEIKQEREKLINDPSIARFAIRGNDAAWKQALKPNQPAHIVSVQVPDDKKRKLPHANKNQHKKHKGKKGPHP